jgi:hypothetical protein
MLDFETQASINLTVTTTSSDASNTNQAFTLAVLNSPEPVAFNTPPDADTQGEPTIGTAIRSCQSIKEPWTGASPGVHPLEHEVD